MTDRNFAEEFEQIANRTEKGILLKLYVWEGDIFHRDCVQNDGDGYYDEMTEYHSGLICVLANSLKQSLNLIDEKYSTCRESFVCNQYVIEEAETFANYRN